ncbi:MAG: membrane or secreted protein [Bacteroidetes bacterium]|nr:membrane or secreted protein [Bacteroidota bacterium]
MKKMLTAYLALIAIGWTPPDKDYIGAWQRKEGSVTHTLVIIDDYFSLSSFDMAGKHFIQTQGGTCVYKDGRLEGKVEYHTMDKSYVGSSYAWKVDVRNGRLRIDEGLGEPWERTDEGQGPLAGNWRITGREQGGKMVEMQSRGGRKTIKLLSGQRFQWAAINTATGEFSGTGGGRYTFADGKYTEHIEFFSRDSSRVGMSLSFDGRVEGRHWYHSGKSSKGDPINERWSR